MKLQSVQHEEKMKLQDAQHEEKMKFNEDRVLYEKLRYRLDLLKAKLTQEELSFIDAYEQAHKIDWKKHIERVRNGYQKVKLKQ